MLELIQALVRSVGFALNGVLFAFRTQRNFRIHLIAAVGVLTAALFFRFSRLEMVLLVLTIALVIAGELSNTALEVALNLLEARHHPVVRHAKDIAAAGVLAAVIGALAVAALLFGPRLCRLWSMLG